MTRIQHKWIVITAIAVVVAAIFVASSEAECSLCPPTRCFDSSVCAPGCACLTPSDESLGVCISLSNKYNAGTN